MPVQQDGYNEDIIPEAGPFLEGHGVLVGERHVSFHETTRKIFESRGVYDVTFGYNLADLNYDTRYPNAGYRYAEDGEVLRAEFTPTTEFCPSAITLVVASFRAWNAGNGSHPYEEVRVRVKDHAETEAINDVLEDAEKRYAGTGTDEETI